MSILSLSNELITAIADIVDPPTIVNFALACRRFSACASSNLALHRSRQQELRVQHDRHPMRILDLLHMASPENLLWYVRTLEFYGGRSSWEQWVTYPDYTRMLDEPKVNLTSLGAQMLSDLDLETFSQKPGLRSFIEKNMERIKQGDDQPLKTVLIASCPSIKKVTWVAHASELDDQPYSLLCDLTSTLLPLPHSLWPPGLLSLRSISLGASSEHVHPHDNLHPDLADFCRLLLLPNLKSLRINVGGFGDPDLEYLNSHVPARSSSVEEIIFCICDFDQSTIVAILKCLRSLKSYAELYLGGWASILEDLKSLFGDSLEELWPVGENDFDMRLFSHISDLSGFPNLRAFNLYVGDLIAEDFTEESLQAIGDGKKVKWHDFDAVLPPAAEHIHLKWPPRTYHDQLPNYNLHKTLFPDLLECLDGFVRSRGQNSGGYLKKICLDLLPRGGFTQYVGEAEGDGFQRLVDNWGRLWAETGVEITMDSCTEHCGSGYEDEKLECQATALEFDSDEEADVTSG